MILLITTTTIQVKIEYAAGAEMGRNRVEIWCQEEEDQIVEMLRPGSMALPTHQVVSVLLGGRRARVQRIVQVQVQIQIQLRRTLIQIQSGELTLST